MEQLIALVTMSVMFISGYTFGLILWYAIEDYIYERRHKNRLKPKPFVRYEWTAGIIPDCKPSKKDELFNEKE